MFPHFVIENIAEAQSRASNFERITQSNNGWGKRHLARFKVVNGVKYQLHATRGWKKVGRVRGVKS